MNTKPIYNLQTRKQSGISISGNSVASVEITLDQLSEFGGDVEQAFHTIKKMQNSGFMPRMGSVAKPLTARDFELYRRNVRLGKRHWQWIQWQGQCVRESTGYDSVWGYGYRTDDGFVIVCDNDEPAFTVKTKTAVS